MDRKRGPLSSGGVLFDIVLLNDILDRKRGFCGGVLTGVRRNKAPRPSHPTLVLGSGGGGRLCGYVDHLFWLKVVLGVGPLWLRRWRGRG